MEKEDTQKYCTYCPDACPYWICRADREGLHGFCQQEHTQSQAYQETRSPQIVFRTGDFFHFPEAESKAGFEASGDDEYYPVHFVVVFEKRCKDSSL